MRLKSTSGTILLQNIDSWLIVRYIHIFMSYQNIYQLLISINIHTIRSSRRPIKTTGLFLDIFRWNSINWTTFVLHVIRTFYQWKVTDIVFRVQNFNTFSIIPENLKVLSWIVLEELTRQNDLLKITKSAIFQTGSDVSKIRLEIFYSRTISTTPENFMKIYPRVWEKSSKKNNNN